MALRGTLEHLGLAAVLQLIGQNARHGVLTVEHGAEQMNLFFASGLLVRADGTGECREERICDRLVAAQLASGPWLQEARASGRRGDELLGGLIAQSGVPQERVAKFAALHSTEAVYRAIAWPTGSYAFLPATAAPQARHAGLKAEHLLMEGLRAQDLWPTLRAQVPNLHTVFEVGRSLEDYLVTQAMQAQTTVKDDFSDGFGFDDGGGSAATESAQGPAPLGHNDRLIYGLVDGQRDVQAIVDLSGLTTVDAIAALVALLNAQLLAQTARLSPVADRADTLVLARAPAVARWRAADVGATAARLALVAAGVALLWWPPLLPEAAPAAPVSAFVQATRTRFTWQNAAPVRMEQLELVRARSGAYPKALPPDGTPQGAPPLYACQGAGYRLRRPLVPTAVH